LKKLNFLTGVTNVIWKSYPPIKYFKKFLIVEMEKKGLKRIGSCRCPTWKVF